MVAMVMTAIINRVVDMTITTTPQIQTLATDMEGETQTPMTTLVQVDMEAATQTPAEDMVAPMII
jgi:hypothetical protein